MLSKRPEQIGVGTLEITEAEKKNIGKVLETGRLSYGPFSEEFEQRFAQMHHSKFAVFVNSGTSALSIALAALKEMYDWQPGDEVIVPALTFVATANMVIDHGFTPVFVDVDSRTYNLDPTKLEAAITDKTRAIMMVHLFGQVGDMDPIMSIAESHGIRIIEDSCETVGASYKGKMAGSFGDIGCFSTYVAHLIVTEVGGLAVTSDPRLAEILRSLANHGRDNIYVSIDDDKGVEKGHFKEVIKRRFRFVRPGYSFRATEFEAAMGCAQLDRYEQTLKKRQQNAAWLTEALESCSHFLQLPYYDASTHDHAFMMYPIVIAENAPWTKEEMVLHLEEMNIETRDMLPLINQPVYDSLEIVKEDFPVADWVNRCGYYIACHQGLSQEDLQYISDVITDFVSQHTSS